MRYTFAAVLTTSQVLHDRQNPKNGEPWPSQDSSEYPMLETAQKYAGWSDDSAAAAPPPAALCVAWASALARVGCFNVVEAFLATFIKDCEGTLLLGIAWPSTLNLW